MVVELFFKFVIFSFRSITETGATYCRLCGRQCAVTAMGNRCDCNRFSVVVVRDYLRCDSGK